MSSSNQKFVKIVEDAENIAETIFKLKEEIASYDSAGQSLEQVRVDLEKYLKTAHEASLSMLNLTNALTSKIDETAKSTIQLKNVTEQGFMSFNNKLQATAEQTMLELNNKASNLKTLIFVAIGISMVSLVIGLFY